MTTISQLSDIEDRPMPIRSARASTDRFVRDPGMARIH
jgi:hypothetical protein